MKNYDKEVEKKSQPFATWPASPPAVNISFVMLLNRVLAELTEMYLEYSE